MIVKRTTVQHKIYFMKRYRVAFFTGKKVKWAQSG